MVLKTQIAFEQVPEELAPMVPQVLTGPSPPANGPSRPNEKPPAHGIARLSRVYLRSRARTVVRWWFQAHPRVNEQLPNAASNLLSMGEAGAEKTEAERVRK